jgi:hypothetical protein
MNNSQDKIKYIPLRKRIQGIIRNRSKLNLWTSSSELFEIISEDIFISKYSVFYYLNEMTEKKEIKYKIIPKKSACNKPTKYYFCKNKTQTK